MAIWSRSTIGRINAGEQVHRVGQDRARRHLGAPKLRSFMTVLGNIVAVTSIIAVVSLIQGLNASVKQAILNQAGADSFNIQQFPLTRSDDEFEKGPQQSSHHVAGRPVDSAVQLAACRPSWQMRRPRDE